MCDPDYLTVMLQELTEKNALCLQLNALQNTSFYSQSTNQLY